MNDKLLHEISEIHLTHGVLIGKVVAEQILAMVSNHELKTEENMTTVTLQVDRVPYQACGECMFLSTSIQQVRKHGIKDVYCNLFSTSLVVTDELIVEPCDECSSMGDV